MATPTCDIITAPPRILPSLDEALERFQGSYHATRAIIHTWYIFLSDSQDIELQMLWQGVLAGLRSPRVRHIYRDPESLQVAQVLARTDPARMLSEVGALNASDPDMQGRHRCKEGWTSVTCLEHWLTQCAMLSLRNTLSPKRRIAWAHLRFLSMPQPKYDEADLQRARSGEDMSKLRVTGSNGVMMPILTEFVQTWRADAVQPLFRIIARIAMNVADIFDYTKFYGHRKVGECPSFRWYYLGLEQARAAWIQTIDECPDAEEDVLPRDLRAQLTSVPFIVLWDWLWAEAQGPYVTDVFSTHATLYDFVVLSLANPRPWPFSKDNLERMQAIAFSRGTSYPDCILARSAPIKWRPAGYPVSMDCEKIENTEAHCIEHHWGRQFYGDDLPLDFFTSQDAVDVYLAALHPEDQVDPEEVPSQLTQNIYDEADLEAYGPALEPGLFAKVVVGFHMPGDQNCTICAEAFEWWNAKDPCLKLRRCGHYFHEECLRQWLNGVAANSNLCPECRTEICPGRRPVRVKGTSGAPLPGDTMSPESETASELNNESEMEEEGSEETEDEDFEDAQEVVPPPVNFSDTISRPQHDFFSILRPGGLGGLGGLEDLLEDLSDELDQFDIVRQRDQRSVDLAEDADDEEDPAEDSDNDYDPAEDSDYDEEPVEAGYALPDADDTETFQSAGLTHRPTSPSYVPHGWVMDGQGNLLPDTWTWRAHRPEPETMYEYDMDDNEDNGSDDDYE